MNKRTVDVICCDGSRNCAIRLDEVYCDGYNNGALTGVFSHFHADHTKDLHKCITSYDVLIAHNVTLEGINALQPGMRFRQQWVSQDYDTRYRFPGGTIRLLKANHIPGSSQVYVEANDGRTMLYSGDFGFPDVQIRHSDYLVIDSTHGDPWFDGQTDRKYVRKRMFEHVRERLEAGQHVAVLAASGTLQEIVRYFEIGQDRGFDRDVRFVMDKKQDKVLRSIYRDESNLFRETVEFDSREFWELFRSDEKCVIFLTRLDISVLDSGIRDIYKIIVDRYRFDRDPIVQIAGGCRFNLASHASINDIYEYIEDVQPKYVVTDNSRSGYAKQLAKMIKQKFPTITTEYRPA